MKDIIAELKWRGLLYQSTDEQDLSTWLTTPRTVYAGFDPTSNSLHVGNLMPLMALRRFQKAGHRPIALVGGATGMIGDPSGKSKERNLLSVEVLRENVVAIEAQMRSFLDFDAGDRSAVMVNNFDWMQGISYLEFLRDVGKNASINVMLAKDSVKGRLDRTDSGLSYTEFSYMLLQAYDFVHLRRMYQCELQLGGSDQWGNITAGIDLARRMDGAQVHGLTCPLLTKSDGSKMGKTESGSVWLSPDKTSPYAFYQYWINVADDDTGKCLRFLTELEQEEIEELDQSREDEPHLRKSQKRLAEALTEMVHGAEGLSSALRATEIFFGAEISGLNDAQLNQIFADVPSQEQSRQSLAEGGVSIVDALLFSGLAKTKGDVRRLIKQGGAYVNNRRVESAEAQLTLADLASESIMVLRSGKKKYALLRFV